MTTEKLLRFALYGFCGAVSAGALYLLLRYGLPVLLPFALAYALSCAVRPAALFLERKTKTPRTFWAVALIVLVAALLTALLWFGASILLREATDAVRAAGELMRAPDNPVSRLMERVENLRERFHLGAGAFSEAIPQMVQSALGEVSTKVAGWAGSILSHLPSFIFSLFVGVIALFYFCLDAEGIRGRVTAVLPGAVWSRVQKTAAAVLRGLGRCVRAYGVILAITFSELLCGFLVMRVKYALLAALIIAIIDVLPVLGVGTVLFPWAMLSFLTGEPIRGVQLLVLFGLIAIVRQAVEPRILGKHAGVHPLVALLSVYAGYRLCGVGGMILAPILAGAVASLLEERKAALSHSDEG